MSRGVKLHSLKLLEKASLIQLSKASGKSLINSTSANATALLQYAPLTLLLGGWDSRRRSGAFRLSRALTSELVAIDAHVGVTSASRMDPKEIVRSAGAGRIQVEDDQATCPATEP